MSVIIAKFICNILIFRCMPSIHPKLRLTRSIKNSTNINTNELITAKPGFTHINSLISSIKAWWIRSKRALSAQNQQVMKAKQTSNKDQTAKNPGVNRGSNRGRESGDLSFKDYDNEDGNTTIIDGEKAPHKGSKGKGKHGKRKGYTSILNRIDIYLFFLLRPGGFQCNSHFNSFFFWLDNAF